MSCALSSSYNTPKQFPNKELPLATQEQLVNELKPVFRIGTENLKKINQELIKANEMINQAAILNAQAEVSRATSEQTLRELNAKIIDLSAHIFYATFHGKKDLSAQQVNQIFCTYLGDNCISVNVEQHHSQINSMVPFIKYLKSHPDIKMCNFIPFQNRIKDVEKLAAYLSQPACKVSSIGFHDSIPAADKKLLEAAAKVRAGTLKIIFKGQQA